MAETRTFDEAVPRGSGWAGRFASSSESLLGRNWGWIVARGVLLIALGVLAFLAPGAALLGFTMVFAAFSFVDGMFSVASGVRGARDKRERWGALLLSGLFGIGIGVLFVLFPLISTFAFAFTTVMLIAVWALIRGICEIAAAIRLRKAIKGEWLLALSGVLSVLLAVAVVFLLALNPAISVLSVAWLIGFYALLSGIALIVLGVRLRKATR